MSFLRALFEKQCEDEVICSDFSPGILGIHMLKGPNSTSANKLNYAYSLNNPRSPNSLESENLSQQGGVEIQLDMVNHNEQVDFEKLDNKSLSLYSYDAHDSLKVRGKCHVQRRCLKLTVVAMVGVVLAMIGVGIAFEINSRKKKNIGNSSLAELDITQPTVNPSFSPSTIFEVDLNNIISGILGSDARCFIVGSDAWEGRRWVIKNDPFMTDISEWGDTEIQIMLQKFVLATIAFATSGQGAPNVVDWMKVEECETHYISCYQDGTIRALVVDNLVVKGVGTIPPEIGLLTTLNHLIIKNNPNLEGVVPSDIGSLVQLRQLGLYNNSLQGELPDDLYTLSNLSFLNLGHNEFRGTISPLIERLTNLETLVLDENEMSGPIVPLKLRKTKIVSLSLSGNKFSGQLAAAMKFLHKIEFLYLDKNDFSGSIPDELGDLTNLKSLALDRNRFRGTLPSQLGLLTDLNFLTMRRNDLTGNIPSELEGLNNLLTLNMAENKFGGSIPQAFGMMTSLKHLYLYENDLTGIFPNFTKNMPDLESLFMSSNRLKGTINPEWQANNLRELVLSRNAFSGSLPDGICRMFRLENLLLDSNQFNGTINNCLGNLAEMKHIYLFDNELTGTIPDGIGRLEKLESLGLEKNKLSDTVRICHLRYEFSLRDFWADCAGQYPEVECPKECCNQCCPDETC